MVILKHFGCHHAVGQASSNPISKNNDHDRAKVVHTAVSHAREGLFGKACQVLTSSGIASKNEINLETLDALESRGT